MQLATYSGYSKAIVMGMLDRELRKVRAHIIPDVKRVTLQDAILNQIEKKSTVYTDGFSGYDHLAARAKERLRFEVLQVNPATANECKRGRRDEEP